MCPSEVRPLHLENGRIIDPEAEVDTRADVLIEDGRITHVGKLESLPEGCVRVELGGKIVCPGLLDMHVHLREPGQEEKETILTGVGAAVSGGFTGVACMANTVPPIDSRDGVEYVTARAEEAGLARVYPVGAVTKAMAGKELTEMAEMVAAGAVGFSDDGLPISNPEIMRRALEYATALGAPVISHAEDLSLRGRGVINEGFMSTRLGLTGIPSAAEEVMVSRDITLSAYTGGKLHIAHVSTRGSVEAIRRAKAGGVNVTAETAPHYLVLTEGAVEGYDTNAKMNPPLRTEEDRMSLIEGLKDGTIDVIASDHAPHTIMDKELEFDRAAFGIVGLETTLGILMTHLVEKGILGLAELIAKLSSAPRRVLGLPGGRIARGEVADLTVIDPEATWRVEPGSFRSKGRNTPFAGWELKGRAAMTIVDGRIVFDASEK